jgi:hypothetical protein
MATISQLPGELNIITTQHDDLSILLDFDIALTGYTFVSKIIISDVDSVVIVTNTDLSAGKITLSVSDTILATVPVGTHKWYLDWVAPGSLNRRILSGAFTIKD